MAYRFPLRWTCTHNLFPYRTGRLESLYGQPKSRVMNLTSIKQALPLFETAERVHLKQTSAQTTVTFRSYKDVPEITVIVTKRDACRKIENKFACIGHAGKKEFLDKVSRILKKAPNQTETYYHPSTKKYHDPI